MADPACPAAGADRSAFAPRKAVLLALAAIVAVSFLARVPTLRAPLDQDCAVYTYVAQRWAAGDVPYRDVWDHKPPFIFFRYRLLFTVTSPSGPAVNLTLRLASAAVDALTAMLLFFLAKRLFGYWQGLAAGLLCTLFTALPDLQYEALQPERFVVLFLTAGFLAATVYADCRCWISLALSGLLFGLALVMKPIAAPAGAVVWAWLTWDAWRGEGSKAIRRIALHSVLLMLGAVLPWLLFMGYFALKGAFGDYWFCTYSYNVLYATQQRRGSLVTGLKKVVTAKMFEHGLWWALAGAGLAIALVRRETRRNGLLALGWLAAAFAGMLLPGQLAYYYYIPTGAALALAGGVVLAAVGAWARGSSPIAVRVAGVGAVALVILAGLGASGLRQKGHLMRQANPRDTNAVVVEVAKHLASATEPDARLYVWGSRPQLYVLSERVGVCPYLYNFSYNMDLKETFLFQKQNRDRIMAGLREHKPPFIVTTETDTLDGFPELKSLLVDRYRLDRTWDGVRWDGKPLVLGLYRRRDGS